MQGLLRCLLNFLEVELSILVLPASVEPCLFVCRVGAGDAPSPTMQMPRWMKFGWILDGMGDKSGFTFRGALA